jgi:hypothetical protein
MAPLRFDKARIEALLAAASEQLDGEWRLIGGAAAAAWCSVARTTEDGQIARPRQARAVRRVIPSRDDP